MIETMSNLQTPPTILVADLATDAALGDPNTKHFIETAPARFAVFKQDDAGWVLRDYRADLDYPFLTKAGAIAGMEKLVTEHMDYLGSPIKINAYGEPLEGIEVFA